MGKRNKTSYEVNISLNILIKTHFDEKTERNWLRSITK